MASVPRQATFHSTIYSQLPTRADPGGPARAGEPEKDSNLQLTWGHGTQGQELGPDCWEVGSWRTPGDYTRHQCHSQKPGGPRLRRQEDMMSQGACWPRDTASCPPASSKAGRLTALSLPPSTEDGTPPHIFRLILCLCILFLLLQIYTSTGVTPYIIQIFALISPSHWGFPWPLSQTQTTMWIISQ